jgi:DNA polymerase (family 10)
MGGKAHGGTRINREDVSALMEHIVLGLHLNRTCRSIQVCGSYRRGSTSSGDLDLVVIPGFDDGGQEDPGAFDNWCTQHFGMQKNGKKPMRTGLINGVQVEFYVATPENLGTFLQMWTGSWQHNVELRKLSLRKGYSMSQYGFRHKKTGELVQCATEKEVYDFLGIDFVIPEDR